MQVRNFNLKNNLIVTAISNAAVECYLQHAAINLNFLEQTKLRELEKVGQIIKDIDSINRLSLDIAKDLDDAAAKLTHEGLTTGLGEKLLNLLDLNYLENLSLTCNSEFFFEALCCSMREAGLKQQNFLHKVDSAFEFTLNCELNVLKQEELKDNARINELERLLTEHIDFKLKREVTNHKKFEMLNNEKITTFFLNLVKGTKKEDPISSISRDDKSQFDSDEGRNNFIKQTFEQLYAIPEDELPLNNGCIEDFLGSVNLTKLYENEKNSMEGPLTIEELDQSINQAKLKSAPGADSYSNYFIKEYWHFFRTPLHKLSVDCYANNKLTNSFSSAEIKLIPKKGNIKLLKNWQPISLLNCFYKTISRAICSRLKKKMDKMTPVCQKGYSKTRRCQEVLLQLSENIEECKIKNKTTAILSLDIRKAFDSIGHQ